MSIIDTAKIVFAGAYGLNSQGDDGPLITLLDSLRGGIASLDAVVIVRPPIDQRYCAYGARSIPNLDYASKHESLGKWFKGFNYSDDRNELNALSEEIASADLLVFGAGNAVNDITFDLFRGPLSYLATLVFLAKMAKTPVMLYALSAGPLVNLHARRLARFVLELSDVVTVRDALSASLFREIGYEGDVIVLPDPIILLEDTPEKDVAPLPVWRQAHQDEKSVVAVAIRALPENIIAMEPWLELTAALCDFLVEQKGLRVLFIPQCTYTRGNTYEDDRVVARMVVERMRNMQDAVLAEGEYTVAECLSLYQGAKLALCTRLHGAVFACMNAVPTIAFNYNPKVEGFMTWLGQPQQIISFDSIDVSALYAKSLATYDNPRLGGEGGARISNGRIQARKYAELALSLLLNATSSPLSKKYSRN